MGTPTESDDEHDRASMAPGDEAPPDHPTAAENACPDCDGSGRRDGGECETCAGSGIVIEGIGGG